MHMTPESTVRRLLSAGAACLIAFATTGCSDSIDLTRTTSDAQTSPSLETGSTLAAADSVVTTPLADVPSTSAPVEVTPPATGAPTSPPPTVAPPETVPPTTVSQVATPVTAAPPTVPVIPPPAPATVPAAPASAPIQSGPCPVAYHDPAVVASCGDTGELVRTVQSLLVCLGYSLSADATFGPDTYRAVVAFQTMHALTSDGLAGPATQATLQSVCDPGAGDY